MKSQKRGALEPSGSGLLPMGSPLVHQWLVLPSMGRELGSCLLAMLSCGIGGWSSLPKVERYRKQGVEVNTQKTPSEMGSFLRPVCWEIVH